MIDKHTKYSKVKVSHRGSVVLDSKLIRYIRLLDLLYELEQARNKDTYKKKLRALSRIELLIIDEFLLTPTTAQQQSDILDLLELRYNTHSTIFASQFLPQGWHENLGGGAIADAILDRDRKRINIFKIEWLCFFKCRYLIAL